MRASGEVDRWPGDGVGLWAWIAVALVLIAGPSPVWAVSMTFPDEGVEVSVQNAPDPTPTLSQADGAPEGGQPAAPGSVPDSESTGSSTLFFEQFNVDVGAAGYTNDVTGNRARSFMDNGAHYRGDLSMQGLARYGQNGVFELNGSFQASDDQQVIPDRRFEVQGLYGEFREQGNYRLRLGNVASSFSSYSLSSSADVGAHLEKRLEVGPFQEVKIYGGRPNRQTGSQFRRYNGGIRVSGRAPEWMLSNFGFNYARTWDDEDSIDNPAPTNRATENDVYSVDATLAPSRRLRITGEFAHSITDTNTLTPTRNELNDNAFRVSASYLLAGLPGWLGGDISSDLQGQVQMGFEQVQPDFRASSAGGSPDNRTWYFQVGGTTRGEGDLPPMFINYSFQMTEDNLEDQLAFETESDIHVFEFNIQPFREMMGRPEGWMTGLWRNLRMDVELRHHLTSLGNFSDQRITEQNYTLSSHVGDHSLEAYYNYVVSLDSLGVVFGGNPDRRHRGFGFNYGHRGWQWDGLWGTPVRTSLNAGVRRTQDWLTGFSFSGSDGVRWDLQLNNSLARNYALNFRWSQEQTDNVGPLNDVRNTNWSIIFLGRQITEQGGQFRLLYERSDFDEDLQSNEFQEETLRGELQFSF